MADSNDKAFVSTDDVHALECKRHALQRLLKITRSLESLREGLEASLQLTAPIVHLSIRALKLFENLMNQMKPLSAKEITEKLSAIDEKMTQELSVVLTIAGEIEAKASNTGEPDELDGVDTFIDRFRRMAQTNVAMRVLCLRRGLTVAPMPGVVDEKQLKDKILRVKLCEQEKREALKQEADTFIVELDEILSRMDSNSPLYTTYKTVMDNLSHTSKCLAQGMSIHDLPMDISAVSLDERDMVVNVPVEADIVSKEAESTEVQFADSDVNVPEAPIVEGNKPVKRPFFQRLRIWLNSSWRKRWKDID